MIHELDSLNKVLKTTEDDTIRGWTYYHLAKVNHELGDVERAVSLAKKCFGFAEERIANYSANQPVLNSLYRLLGQISKYLGDIYNPHIRKDSLIIYFETCIRYNDSVKNTIDQSTCTRDLGKYLMMIGDTLGGLKRYKMAMKLEKRNNDSAGLSTSLASLGHTYRWHGKMELAKSYLFQAAQIKKAIGDLNMADRLLNELGLICVSSGDFQTASEYFYMAMQNSKGRNDMNVIAMSYNNLSLMYQRQENYKKALEMIGKSLDICKTENINIGVGICFKTIGTLYDAIEQYDRAILYYDSSLTILDKIGAIEQVTNCKLAMSASYLKIGDVHKSEILLNDIVSVGDQIKNKLIIANAQISLASLFLATSRYKKAINHAEIGLRLMEGLDDINLSRKVANVLSRAYEELGNYPKAFFHYKNYVFLNDSIMNIEAQRVSIEKDAEFQIRQGRDSARFAMRIKENEIQTGNAKIQVLSQQKEIKNRTIAGISIASLLLVTSLLFWFRSYRKDKKIRETEYTSQINLKMQEIDHLQSMLQSHLEQRTILKGGILDGSINEFLSMPLSKRELEVLEELSKGNDNHTIAKNLFVSVNTIRTHLANIYEKLEVDNRLQAVNKAVNIQSNLKSSD